MSIVPTQNARRLLMLITNTVQGLKHAKHLRAQGLGRFIMEAHSVNWSSATIFTDDVPKKMVDLWQIRTLPDPPIFWFMWTLITNKRFNKSKS